MLHSISFLIQYNMDYQTVIEKIYGELQGLWGQGKVADYIPALAKVNPRQFGISLATLDGQYYRAGDAETCFSIQSISKVFSLAMVTRHIGDEIWQSVGREPSGNPFNSLVQLEYEHGKPRNPFINAGALVVTDRLISLYPHPKDAILEFVRGLCNNDDIYYDKEIARSERANADRNMALAYLMKSFGNIRNDVDTLIDVYCHQCAISMSCVDLSRAFLFLCNRGLNPFSGEQVLTGSQAKRLGALMLTCGFYDESGDFAFRAGVPTSPSPSGVPNSTVTATPLSAWKPSNASPPTSAIPYSEINEYT